MRHVIEKIIPNFLKIKTYVYRYGDYIIVVQSNGRYWLFYMKWVVTFRVIQEAKGLVAKHKRTLHI